MNFEVRKTIQDDVLVARCYGVVQSITRFDQVPLAKKFVQQALRKVNTKNAAEFMQGTIRVCNQMSLAGSKKSLAGAKMHKQRKAAQKK